MAKVYTGFRKTQRLVWHRGLYWNEKTTSFKVCKRNERELVAIGLSRHKKACPKAIAIVQLQIFLKEMKNYGQLKGRILIIQAENLSIRILSIMGV